MNKILVRSASGIVYIALIVGAVLAGGWWFLALMTLFTVLATLEYQHLMAVRHGGYAPVYVRAMDMVMALSLLGFMGFLIGLEAGASIICLYVFAVSAISRFVFALMRDDSQAITNIASSFLGLIYIVVPLGLLTAMMCTNFAMTKTYVLTMFILIWLNDTGAFCFGSMLGRHKLCERLSPKKSWEGFWGGFGVCIVAGVVYAICIGHNVVLWGVFGALVSIMATWGDLFESLLKRNAGVKDAGHIMPGHGGVLDRIDSLLFVAPVTILLWGTMLIMS